MNHAVVVGAGAAGLAAALSLLESGWTVQILERSHQAGGLAGSTQAGAGSLERFYHHSFIGQDDILKMADRLNLSDRVTWGQTKMGFFSDGELFPFNGPIDLLRFRPLPFSDRIRLGLGILRLGKMTDWKALDQQTAQELLLQQTGPAAWKAVWEPLLRQKFSDRLGSVSATWAWERLASRRKSQKLRQGKESLGYIRGGSGLLLERLADFIREKGARIQTGCSVKKLLIQQGRCVGVLTEDRTISADAVIVTTPIPYLKEMAPDLPPDYLSKLNQIQYQSAVCLLLRLRKSLSPYYWINVADPNKAFAVVVEHTHLAPRSDYQGEHLVYLGSYLPPDHPRFRAPEAQVTETFLKDLKEIFPDFSTQDLIGTSLARERYAQPVFHQRFLSVRPDYHTPIQNLFLATTAQSFPESRSVNTALRLGKEAAQTVLSRTQDPLSAVVA